MENTCRLLPLLRDLLNEEKIPFLKWVNKEQQIWQLPWKHHRPTKWGDPDAYMLCEIAKKMYNFKGLEPDPKELKIWKERLRNALRSLGVKELEDLRQQDGEIPLKVYQFSSDSVNGKRPRGTSFQRRGAGNSPQKAESCDNFDQLSFQHFNGTLSHPDALNSMWSYRSRSPVHDFPDIDTDGFSGNLESVISNGEMSNGSHFPDIETDGFSGNPERLIPNSQMSNVVHFHPETPTVFFSHANGFSINSNSVKPSGHALINHEEVNDFAASSSALSNLVDNMKTNLENGWNANDGKVEKKLNNSEQRIRNYQLAIDDTGNIPNFLHSFSVDSNDSENQEWPYNFYIEPSLTLNMPFDGDGADNPFISLSVNYMDKTVLIKRISDPSVRLCYVPDETSRESITSCPISEQYGPVDAKLVALPHADRCPGLDRNYVSVIQKILVHMQRGITIVYKGDDIFARRLCKAVPYYGIPQEKQNEKLQRDTEVKIFDFQSYFHSKFFEENVIPNPFVRLTFSVKQPDRIKIPPLSVDIWHMKANKLVQARNSPKHIYSLEPDCSLSNEFDTRLKIEQNLKC